MSCNYSDSPRVESKDAARSHGIRNRSVRIDNSEPKLPQPNFDESDESEKAGKAERLVAASDPPSDSDTCSLFEYVPQSRSR